MPAVRSLQSSGQQLEPFRVDLSRASDAILTEILTAIADSHCILADITSQIEVNDRPIRNANVMYEVGLAHAVRLPEEVVLFRSDKGALDFDIAGVRVHSYQPDVNPEESCKLVAETVVASLAALDARRRTSLRAASERLTQPATMLLIESLGARVNHPEMKTMEQILGSVQRTAAISLLLDLGALRAEPIRLTPELLEEKGDAPNTPLLTYALTPFGRALIEVVADSMGAFDPAMKHHIDALMLKLAGDVTA